MRATSSSTPHVLMLVGETIGRRRRTGIQRVTIETARGLAGQADFDLVRWDYLEGRLRYLDAAELDRLFGPGAWPEGIRLRPEARRLQRLGRLDGGVDNVRILHRAYSQSRRSRDSA